MVGLGGLFGQGLRLRLRLDNIVGEYSDLFLVDMGALAAL